MPEHSATRPRRPARTVAVALAAAGTVAAAALAVAAVVFGSTHAEASDRVPDLHVDRSAAEARIHAAEARATGASAAALADGRASRAEYLAGVERTLECLTQGVAGLTSGGESITARPSEPVLSGDGFEYAYTYAVSGPVDPTFAVADAVSRVEQACQAEHLLDVQWAYQLDLRADRAYVDAVGRSFEACARAAGAPVDVRGRNAVEVAAELGSPQARERHPGVRRCIAERPSIVTDVASDPMDNLRR